jgi:alkylhydroperoxidase family enzyme
VSPAVLTRLRYEELEPELRALLAPRVERLGYLGEFFAVAGQQPDALAHFHRFTDSLKAALPWRLTEVIALTVAALADNAYERVQHERLALTLGMDRASVAALARGDADDADLDDAERAAARVARAMAESVGRDADSALDALALHTDEPTAIACALMAGRYLAHAAISNAFGLRPPVASPLAEAARA